MLTYNGANSILNTLANGKYVGLSTTTPQRDGSGYTEPASAAGYSRVYITQNGAQANMGQASLGSIKNNAIIYFPEATASWGTCTNFLIFGSASGSDLVAYGALTSSITPTTDHVPIIRVEDLVLSLS